MKPKLKLSAFNTAASKKAYLTFTCRSNSSQIDFMSENSLLRSIFAKGSKLM